MSEEEPPLFEPETPSPRQRGSSKETSLETLEKQQSPHYYEYFFGTNDLPRESSEVEANIDKAIFRGDFDIAKEMAEGFLSEFDQVAYAHESHRTLLRYLALPFYERHSIERAGGKIDEDLEDRIAAVYADSAAVMRLFRAQENAIFEANTANSREHNLLRGDLTELTIFSLITREMRGEPADIFSILPATLREDMGQRTDDGKTGFDFEIKIRPTSETVPLQVKTGLTQGAEEYYPSILVVSLRELVTDDDVTAREEYSRITSLQDAILSEVESDGFGPGRWHIIELATNRLRAKLHAHFTKTHRNRIKLFVANRLEDSEQEPTEEEL